MRMGKNRKGDKQAAGELIPDRKKCNKCREKEGTQTRKGTGSSIKMKKEENIGRHRKRYRKEMNRKARKKEQKGATQSWKT